MSVARNYAAAPVRLSSATDLVLAGAGVLDEAVRSVRVPAVVAVRRAVTAVPPSLAKARGLGTTGGQVQVEVCGRSATVRVTVGPAADGVVVGHIVLTALDLVVDEISGERRPRDAAGIVYDV